jgi:ribonuclease BN (tRNA processing enzyme)
VLVTKAAAKEEISLIWLQRRLVRHVSCKRHKKPNKQTTHSSSVSVTLVAKAAASEEMSLIWLPSRLQSNSVKSKEQKTNKEINKKI